MENWKSKSKGHSDQEEFDLDSIDQAVFDNPVLLLEYLEKRDSQKKLDDPGRDYLHQTGRKNSPAPKRSVPLTSGNRDRSSTLYGYTTVNGEIQINHAHAEAIRKIIEWHDAGYSYSQIEYMLGRTEYRTITGKKFYLAAVQSIIKNRKVYEGETGYPPILREKKSGNKNVLKERSQVSVESGHKETVKEKATNHPRVLWMKKTEPTEKKETPRQTDDRSLVYNSVDQFLNVVQGKGVPVKDNRWNDGCVWVQADPRINVIIAKVKIKGRGFKYAPKCRAFGGKAGWYY